MSRKTKRGMLLCVGLSLLPGVTMADPILMQRCSNDSLDNNQAIARLEWARRCSLLAPFAGPSTNSGLAAPDYTTPLYEYTETGASSYTGDNWGREINATSTELRYLSGATYQGADQTGFYKWSRPGRDKRRVLYPIFGSIDDVYNQYNTQLYPSASLSDCRLYSSPTGGAPSASFFVNGYCEASCYTPEQTVLFAGGEVPIVKAVEQRRSDVVTLSEDSTLDNVQLKNNRTYSFTRETHEAEHKLVEFTTASGGTLRVTDEHPVIQGEGRIVQARTLKEGDALLKVDGSQDLITRIHTTTYTGRVYNLRPVSQDRVSNILVAQGFLVGSSLFQNEEVDFLNRQILYKSVPAETLP